MFVCLLLVSANTPVPLYPSVNDFKTLHGGEGSTQDIHRQFEIPRKPKAPEKIVRFHYYSLRKFTKIVLLTEVTQCHVMKTST